MSHLRLVKSAKPVTHPRPIQTYYFSGPNGSETDWTRKSRAATPIGALRAAITNMLLGRYGSADIYDEMGVRKYRIRMHGNKLMVIGWFKPLRLIK